MSIYIFISTSLTSKHIILVLHVGMKIQALVVKYEPFVIQMHLINSTNTGECIVKIQHPSYKKYSSQKISRMQSAKTIDELMHSKTSSSMVAKETFQDSWDFPSCITIFTCLFYTYRQIYTCLYIQSALNLTMKHCDTVIVH